MTKALLDVWQLSSGEWPVLREIRLRALAESPDSFTADPAREAALTEPEWRDRLDTTVWVAARDQSAVIGIAALLRGHRQHPGWHVESIWVEPEHRDRGVFRSLLVELVATVRRRGERELYLWVLEDNVVARAVYDRFGFAPTRQRQQIPGRPERFEIRLRLGIEGPGLQLT